MSSAVYYDEEDCLPLEAFTNELEVLVSSAKLQAERLDQAQLFELLPKLASATCTTEDRAVVKAMQARCEPALTELISGGLSSTVLRLVCVCLSRFYLLGNTMSIYARVNSIQSILNGKDPATHIKPLSEAVRASLLEVLGHLALHHGSYLAFAAVESMAIAISSSGRSGAALGVRLAGVRLASATVEGLFWRDRAAIAIQAEAFNLLHRCCRVVREGFAQALSYLAVAVQHEALEAAIKAETRPIKKVALERLQAGQGAAALQAALGKPLAEAAVHSQGSVCAALAVSWTSYVAYMASSSAKQPGSAALVDAAMQVMLMCDMAAAVLSDARAKGLVTDSSLGAALASGEVPYAQASALHILSTSILPALSDQNRRALLTKLAALLAKPGCATPTAVVAIEGLSLLMGVLGELGDGDAGELVERMLIAQTSSHSGPVRYQAARGLAAMVSAQPARAARVISRQLDCLQAAANLLCGQHVSTGPLGMDTSALGELIGKAQPGLIAAAHGAALAAAAGLWVAPQLPLSIPRALPCRAAALARHLITEPHATGNTPRALLKESGYILLNVLLECWTPTLLSVLAGPTLHATTQPCPTPGPASDDTSSQPVSPFAAAVSSFCSLSSTSSSPVSAAGKRAAAAPGATFATHRDPANGVAAGGLQGCDVVLGLLGLALGPQAHQDLSDQYYLHPGGDADLAMQLWWRAVALQALNTYLARVMAPGLASNAAAQLDTLATWLVPVLELMDSQDCLKEPARAKGGPQGLLAACAATFQLRLLQCLHALPATSLHPGSQSQLIRLCMRPIQAVAQAARPVPGGQATPPVQPDAAFIQTSTFTVLPRAILQLCLAKEDGVLGPWPPGRDVAEEELRVYAGERGAPHVQLGEPSLLQCALGHLDPCHTGVVPRAYQQQAAGQIQPSSHSQTADQSGALPHGSWTPMYPQPLGLGVSVLAMQAICLGKVLAQMSPPVQIQLLDELLDAALAVRSSRKVATSTRTTASDRASSIRRHGSAALVAVAALAACLPWHRSTLPTSTTSSSGPAAAAPLHITSLLASVRTTDTSQADKLADKVLHLANALLDEDGAAQLGIARAGAQLLAASACIGSDAWAVQLVAVISEELVRCTNEGRYTHRRAALALALGCIHRAKGGLALQAHVPVSVGALMAVARRPAGCTAVWALHALSLCAQASGPAFTSHIHGSLRLARDLLLTSQLADEQLRPAAARLANAVVGVMGPELSLGSATYLLAKCLTRDLCTSGALVVHDPALLAAVISAQARGQVEEVDAGKAGQEVAVRAPWPIAASTLECELQAVLFTQQLVLCCGQAVQISKHLAVLQATLLSEHHALHKAAVGTLRLLAGKDAQAVLSGRIEVAVITALDSETDAVLAAHLRDILEVLLDAGACSSPDYWLDCLTQAAFSPSPTSSGTAASGGAAGADKATAARAGFDDDEPEPEDRPVNSQGHSLHSTVGSQAVLAPMPSPGSSKPRTPTTARAGQGMAQGEQATPGGSTKLASLGSSAELGRLQTGEEGPAGSTLHQLQRLVEVGYKLATGPLEALRPAGVQLLDQLVQGFSQVEDPLMPGARLLEQYQAQLVSALRTALAPGSAPTLLTAGWRLSTCFLASGLTAASAAPTPMWAANSTLAPCCLKTSPFHQSTAWGWSMPSSSPSLKPHQLQQWDSDGVVLRRLLELLVSPLASWHALGAEQQYGEWVGLQQRVALLEAHAQCTLLQWRGSDAQAAAIIGQAQRPHRLLLHNLWAALLQDWVVLSTQHATVCRKYPVALLTPAPPGPTLDQDHDPAVDTATSTPHPIKLTANGSSNVAARGAVSAAAQSLNSNSALSMLPDTIVLLLDQTSQVLAKRVAQLERAGGSDTHQGDGSVLAAAVDKVVTCCRAAQRLAGAGKATQHQAPPAFYRGIVASLKTLLSKAAAPLCTAVLTGQSPSACQAVPDVLSATAELLMTLVQHCPDSLLGPLHLGAQASEPDAPQQLLKHSSHAPHSQPASLLPTAVMSCVAMLTSLITSDAKQPASHQSAATASSTCPSQTLTLSHSLQPALAAALGCAGTLLARLDQGHCNDQLQQLLPGLLKLSTQQLLAANSAGQLQAAASLYTATQAAAAQQCTLMPSEASTPVQLVAPSKSSLAAAVVVNGLSALSLASVLDTLHQQLQMPAEQTINDQGHSQMSGSSNSDPDKAVEAERAAVLAKVAVTAAAHLAASAGALSAVSPCTPSLGQALQTASRVQRHLRSTLTVALQMPPTLHQPEQPPPATAVAAATAACSALSYLLQQLPSSSSTASHRAWAWQLLCQLGPLAVARIRTHLCLPHQQSSPGTLSNTNASQPAADGSQLAGAVLQLLAAGAPCACSPGSVGVQAAEAAAGSGNAAAADAYLQLLLSLLVEAAAPASGSRPDQQLSSLALHLITTLPLSPVLGALAWRRSWSSRLLVGACLAAAAMCRLLGHGSVLLPLCLATTSGAVYFIGPLLVYSSLNRKMQAIIAKSEMRDIRTNWASHNSSPLHPSPQPASQPLSPGHSWWLTSQGSHRQHAVSELDAKYLLIHMDRAFSSYEGFHARHEARSVGFAPCVAVIYAWQLVVGATAVHLGSVDYPSEAPVTEDDLQGSVASIFRMTIDSSVRRAGIGSKLLGAAEEYAKARGYQSMLLHTANQAARLSVAKLRQHTTYHTPPYSAATSTTSRATTSRHTASHSHRYNTGREYRLNIATALNTRVTPICPRACVHTLKAVNMATVEAVAVTEPAVRTDEVSAEAAPASQADSAAPPRPRVARPKPEVVIREFKEDDQQVLYDMWVEGFEETIMEGALAYQRKPLTRMLVVTCVVIAAACRLLGYLGALPSLGLAFGITFAYFAFPPLMFNNSMRKMKQMFKNSDMHDIQKNWASHSNRAFWVAQVGDKVVGATGLHLGPKDYPGPSADKADVKDNDAFIFRMTTSRTKLLTAAEELARAKGFRRVQLITAFPPAIHFYHKNGYNTIKKLPFGSLTGACMEKLL
ncbi:hypothetical protein V8C86DRAFT_2436239 [Haematococcus lacustris]